MVCFAYGWTDFGGYVRVFYVFSFFSTLAIIASAMDFHCYLDLISEDEGKEGKSWEKVNDCIITQLIMRNWQWMIKRLFQTFAVFDIFRWMFLLYILWLIQKQVLACWSNSWVWAVPRENVNRRLTGHVKMIPNKIVCFEASWSSAMELFLSYCKLDRFLYIFINSSLTKGQGGWIGKKHLVMISQSTKVIYV